MGLGSPGVGVVAYIMKDSLAFNDEIESHDIYGRYYSGVFGSMLLKSEPLKFAEHRKAQFDGMDRLLHLSDGRIVSVEEKTDKGQKCIQCPKRFDDKECPTCHNVRYNDTIFLELRQKNKQGNIIPGCFIKSLADVWVYTRPTGLVTSFPIRKFREQIWTKMEKEWRATYREHQIINEQNFVAYGIGVPSKIIHEKILELERNDICDMINRNPLPKNLYEELDIISAKHKQDEYSKQMAHQYE